MAVALEQAELCLGGVRLVSLDAFDQHLSEDHGDQLLRHSARETLINTGHDKPLDEAAQALWVVGRFTGGALDLADFPGVSEPLGEQLDQLVVDFVDRARVDRRGCHDLARRSDRISKAEPPRLLATRMSIASHLRAT